MFGIGKKTNQPDPQQLPYGVYETVQGQSPTRRWLIRLAAALVVATVLVFGGWALWNALRDDGPSQTGGTNQAGSQGGQDQNGAQPENQEQGGQPEQGKTPQPETPPPAPEQPSPQPDPPLPNTGSDAPQDDTNTSTVRKPE